MKRKISIGASIALVIIGIVVTFQVTYFIVGRQYDKKLSDISGAYDLLEKIGDLDSIVDFGYFFNDDEASALNALMSGYISSTSDIFSAYLTKEEYEAFSETKSGSDTPFGFDILCDDKTGQTFVQYIHPSSSAAKKGLMQGDIIYSLNGEMLIGKPFVKIIAEFNKTSGDTAVIDIIRGNEIVSFELDKSDFEVINFDERIIDGDILYLYLGAFDSTSVSSAISAIASKKDTVRGIIFDIRNSKSGSSVYVQELLDALLPEMDIITVTNKDGSKTVRKSTKDEIDIPSAIIVGENTAGTAELFAQVMRDAKGTKIIGETTYGKDTEQKIFHFSDGSAVIISDHTFSSSLSSPFAGAGIKPDIEAETSLPSYVPPEFISSECAPIIIEAINTIVK